jgi:hypothetical protein
MIESLMISMSIILGSMTFCVELDFKDHPCGPVLSCGYLMGSTLA